MYLYNMESPPEEYLHLEELYPFQLIFQFEEVLFKCGLRLCHRTRCLTGVHTAKIFLTSRITPPDSLPVYDII